jgi:hypothetical protein
MINGEVPPALTSKRHQDNLMLQRRTFGKALATGPVTGPAVANALQMQQHTHSENQGELQAKAIRKKGGRHG